MSQDDADAEVPSSIIIDRTTEFDAQFARLPKAVQKQTLKSLTLFQLDPHYPSLRIHAIQKTSKNSVIEPTISISISMKYRALLTYETDSKTNTTTYTFYWIGTHADYDKICGGK